MRLAVPIFGSRVSPVFDFSTHTLVIEIGQGEGRDRTDIDLTGFLPHARVERLKNEGVDTIICAGLSMSLHRMLVMAGLEVIPGIVGPVEEVIGAFKSGQLKEGRFMMPGCCRRRQRKMGRCRGRM